MNFLFKKFIKSNQRILTLTIAAVLILSGFLALNKINHSQDLVDIQIPLKYTESLVVTAFNHSLSIQPVNASTSAKAIRDRKNPNVVKYIDVFQNTDIVLTKHTAKLKEDIILKQPGHPQRFSYLINCNEYSVDKDTEGNIHFSPKNGKDPYLDKFFFIPAPFMIDAQGAQSSTKDVEMFIEDNVLILIPNPEWLKTHPYPIILDPTIEIHILNVYSHPHAGDDWAVSFTTKGAADLFIIPNDQATIDDLDFVSLKCGAETRAPQILDNDVIFYPNWSCNEKAQLIHLVNIEASHTLEFQFGGQVKYAYNNPDSLALIGNIRLKGGIRLGGGTASYLAPAWYNSNWSYRKQITIDHTEVDADLANMPVLVNLVSDADLVISAQADGDDILFTDLFGSKLSHEIEKYTSGTGELQAWVKANLKNSTNTVLYMYYGNTACASQQNINGVWTSDVRMVQHLQETPQGTVYDSTSYNNDSLSNNADPTISGQIDGAYAFTAANSDYINCYDSQTQVLTQENNKFYIQEWKYFSDLAEDDEILTFNPETGEEEWHKPSAYIAYPYAGKMFHFYGQEMDLLVTPDHQMFASVYENQEWSEFKLVLAQEIENKRIKVKTGQGAILASNAVATAGWVEAEQELEDYDGMVYDVTVENHILLVRKGQSSSGGGLTSIVPSFSTPVWSGNCSNDPSLNITDAITIEAWAKANGANEDGYLVAKTSTGGLNSGYSLQWKGSADKIRLVGSVTAAHESDAVFADNGVWAHAVITFDGTTIKFYRNGVAAGTATDTIPSVVTNVYIGDRVNGGAGATLFNGSIDEVKIYNRALTQEEISTHYSNQNNPSNFYTLGAEEVNNPNNIGIAGTQGFGLGACPPSSLPSGFSALAGSGDKTSANYGNYQFQDGSIMVYIPKFYYKVGTGSNGLAVNVIDVKSVYDYATRAAAEADGYALHRVFIDGGAIKDGFFVDKYMASKTASGAGYIASSIQNGLPISTAATHNSIADLTACSSNYYWQTINAAHARDGVNGAVNSNSIFQVASRFQYSAMAMLSMAHGQASSATTYCAWYDATYNYPKGCNNNNFRDYDEVTNGAGSGDDLVYTHDGYASGNCGKTGSGVPFAKSTHNGQNSGVADLNGLMWEVTLGVTRNNSNFYVVKEATSMKHFTPGNSAATDHWGASGISNMMESLTVRYITGNDGWIRFGNSSNQVLAEDISGNEWKLTGLGIPETSSGLSVAGTNLFGVDGLYRYLRDELCLLSCAHWSYGSPAGVWAVSWSGSRAYSNYPVGFRAACYPD